MTSSTAAGAVSVAMCTYNGQTYLPQQLGSIAAQERLPQELVVCDDGSTDRTVALLDSFARTAPFAVRVYRNPVNLGYARNFARAVSLCFGDIIALCDQDDVWRPHKLTRLCRMLAADPGAGGVFSNGDLITPTSQALPGDMWSSFRFFPADQARFAEGDALKVLMQRNVVTGMTLAFRRGLAPKLLEGMPKSWHHDSWIALMIAVHSRLLVCAERLVAYRVHGTQQVGVPLNRSGKLRFLRRNGIRSYLRQSRERNVGEYVQMAKHFDDLIGVLRSRNDPAEHTLLALAEQKSAHAHRSLRLLEQSRFFRAAEILRHRGDYHRYSPTGVQAMYRDLVL